MTQLSEYAQQLLAERYLAWKPDGSQETLNELLDRVSLGNPEYRRLMEEQRFLPNSPTLFNLGVSNGGTSSACFKFDVGDNLLEPGGIMDVARKAAAVLKAGGGVGYTVSAIRPAGSLVNSTHGSALGPLRVLSIYQNLAHNLTQGGKREGAQMGILHVDHPDIRDFIHLKDENPDYWETFNISVAATDSFMEAVKLGDTTALGLFHQITEAAWLTGDPGLYFIDVAERGNPTPWLGMLTGTNPCGEVPLLDNEPCNLGSINLAQHLMLDERGWQPDLAELERTVRLAVGFLDDILDNNTFPDEAITKIAMLTRKLGLGVCGLAEALAIMGIQYDSNEAVQLSEDISKAIQQWAHDESTNIGYEKGMCPALALRPDSYDSEVLWQRRNATVTCIAPTGSISQLMETSSGIEPYYSLYNTRKRRHQGEWLVSEERVNFSSFVPHTAHEIHWSWHVKHQAAWQANVDLAVSKTINMPNDATVEDIASAYRLMWELGCKGGTIYRDGSREVQVLTEVKPDNDKTRLSIAIDNFISQNTVKPIREKLARTGQDGSGRYAPGRVYKVNIEDTEGYVLTGEHSDGRLGELFLNMSRQGSTDDALYDAIAILTSIGIQHGVPLALLVEKFSHTRFNPSGFTGDPELPTATSILDYIFRRLGLDYLANGEVKQMVATGMRCPSCGGKAITQSGCWECADGCGWSKC